MRVTRMGVGNRGVDSLKDFSHFARFTASNRAEPLSKRFYSSLGVSHDSRVIRPRQVSQKRTPHIGRG